MPTTTWSTTGAGSTVWASSNADYKDRWGDWASITWGAIASSGFTWGQLAGYTFVATTVGTTVWVTS